MCDVNELNRINRILSEEYRRVYGNNVSRILIYGSYARGDDNEQSDIDIVAIVHGNRSELQEQLKEIWNVAAELGLEKDVVISPTVIPYDEFEAYKTILPYYMNIDREGLEIG